MGWNCVPFSDTPGRSYSAPSRKFRDNKSNQSSNFCELYILPFLAAISDAYLQRKHHACTHLPYWHDIGQGAKLSCSSSWLFSAAGATINVPAKWKPLGGGSLPPAVSNSVTSICSLPHSSLLRNMTNVSKAFNCISVFKRSPKVCENTYNSWIIQYSVFSL